MTKAKGVRPGATEAKCGISRRSFLRGTSQGALAMMSGSGLVNNAAIASASPMEPSRDLLAVGTASDAGAGEQKTTRMLFYQPPGQVGLDNWCIKKDDLWYVYVCQENGIGVAVSRDLTSYEYRALAIPGSWFRGDTFVWKGKYYMLYAQDGWTYGNSINLAESSDLLKWQNSPKNPVLSLPDSRWYDGTSYKDSLRKRSSCRDVSVIDDACTEEWVYCCFAADTGRGDYYRRGCIGLARSKNLTDWEYLPPLFSPGMYTMMEVPQVCKIGSRWFLTWLHCPWYGLRTDEDLGQRAYTSGETMIHYAVADDPLGPYRLPGDPTLFRGLMSPYVIDLVHDEGQVMLIPTIFKQQEKSFCEPGPVPIGAGDVPRLSFERERFGIGPAMPVRQAANKPEKLEVCFPERLRAYFAGSLAVVDPLRVNTPEAQPEDVAKRGNQIRFTNTSLRVVELSETTPCDLFVSLECRVEAGRLGLVVRYDPSTRYGCAMLLDPKHGELQFAELVPMYAQGMILKVLERHNITSRIGTSFGTSIVCSRDYQLVFVNDVLVGTFSFARRNAGKAALVMENATGQCVVGAIRTINP